jgi:RecG-like helicase
MNPSNPHLPNRPVPDPNKRPSIRESLRVLQTPLRFLKGVGPKRAEELEKFGLKSVEDLLYHLPFRYDDRRKLRKSLMQRLGEMRLLSERFVGSRKNTIRAGELSLLSGLCR